MIHAGLETPITDPVLVFGVAVAIFLIAPLVLSRYRLPGIVGIILAGAIVGPNALGLLDRGEAITTLGEVGLVYLLFVAGLEIEFAQFVETRERSVGFGLLSFVIPQAAGTIAGLFVLNMSLPAALLFASIFASHTLLAYPVVSRLGLTDRESVTATIGGTIVTDTIALLVLAVVVAAKLGTLDAAFWLQLGTGLAGFFLIVWYGVPLLSRWFFRTVHQESYFEYLFVLAVVFVCGYLAEVAGVEAIIGSFFAGIALNRQIPGSGPLMNRIQFVGNALFIPFFLLSVGMLVDVRAILTGFETLIVATTLIVLVLTTKLAAAWLAGALYGYTPDERLTAFGLSVGQAAAALAIVLIGFEVGLFERSVIDATVLMILVTSVVSPAVVDRYGRRVLRATPGTLRDTGRDQRVLVLLTATSEYGERLLDLALGIRDDPDTGLYAMTVVRPGPSVSDDVAAAERHLGSVAEYATSAEVSVTTQTRIDHNVASGIARAAVENRISTVILGWDGAASRRQVTFGETIDQVLAQTRQTVLVAHIRNPLNVTSEVVVVLPPGIEHNGGIIDAVGQLKRLGAHTGAPIRALVVADSVSRYERLFDRVGPDMSVQFDSVTDWGDMERRLADVDGTETMIALLSARRGEPGWHPRLRTLPKTVAKLSDGNFIVLYPAGEATDDDRRFFEFQ